MTPGVTAPSHPLSEVVLSAFTSQDQHHDEASMAVFLAGSTFVHDPKSKRAVMNAYHLVAEDVLGCLLHEGRLDKTSQGGYVLKQPAI